MGVLVFIGLLAGCSPSGTEPDLQETAVPTTSINPDAQAYANDLGISIEEASQRLGWEDSIGELNASLEANEGDSFAGLWIEHEPGYKVVVAFVGEGEEVIRPYLTNGQLADVLEIRSAQYTYAELLAAQEASFAIIEQVGTASIGGWVDVKENRAILSVGNPDLFLQEIADAGFTLPPMVLVEPIDPDNIPESNEGGVIEYEAGDGRIIYFPYQAPSIDSMAALLEGTLVIDESGCLRVQHENMTLADAPVVVWHYGFSLAINDEEINVLNSVDEVVGRVGKWSRMGGGESRTIVNPEMPTACSGPYWILGGIETMAEQAIPDIFTQPAAGAIYYYQSKAAANEGTVSGQLAIDSDGCFRVGGYAIFWPPDIWPDGDVDPMQIVYRKDGVEAVMFTLGDSVELAGSEKTAVDYRFFENKINCSGPYWGMASLVPEQ